MKVISTVHMVLFFKTTAIYVYLEHKDLKIHFKLIWKLKNMQTTKISSTYDKKWNLHFDRNYSKCL